MELNKNLKSYCKMLNLSFHANTNCLSAKLASKFITKIERCDIIQIVIKLMMSVLKDS